MDLRYLFLSLLNYKEKAVKVRVFKSLFQKLYIRFANCRRVETEVLCAILKYYCLHIFYSMWVHCEIQALEFSSV